jgi:hypothetical protein
METGDIGRNKFIDKIFGEKLIWLTGLKEKRKYYVLSAIKKE